MAYITSTQYKNKIYAPTSLSTLKIYINDTVIDNDYVMDIQLDDECFEDDTFTLGSATIQKLILKLDNNCLPCEISEINQFKIVYGLEVSNDIFEWIPIGEYYLGKEPDTTSSEYTIFNLYDYMGKFDIEYDGSSIVPCTRKALLLDICEKVGIELATPTFLGYDKLVGVYDNTITARQYLSFISERAGGFAKIGRDRKLYIKSYADVDVTILNEEESASAVINSFDELKTITKVFYEDATNKFEFGNDSGLIIQLSSQSPFSTTKEEVQEIYDKLNGLSFQSLNVKMWGDPALDTGDILSVYGYKTFVQKHWKFNNGFYGDYKTTLKTVDTISKVEKISSKNEIKRLYSKIDEENGKIELLSKVQSEQSTELASLTIESNNIKQTVSSQETTINELQEGQASLETRQTSLETTVNGVDITIQTLGTTISNMKYSFGTEALKIADENSKTNALFSNTGVKIFNYSTLSSIFTDKGTGVDKLIVTGTAQIGYLKFVKSIKNSKKCTTLFHLNNLVEDLQDLESD